MDPKSDRLLHFSRDLHANRAIDMGCCIVGALIMFYLLESWRRVRAFFGVREAEDPAHSAPRPRNPARAWAVLGAVLGLEIMLQIGPDNKTVRRRIHVILLQKIL